MSDFGGTSQCETLALLPWGENGRRPDEGPSPRVPLALGNWEALGDDVRRSFRWAGAHVGAGPIRSPRRYGAASPHPGESTGYTRDLPVDLTNCFARSPAKHFSNRLLTASYDSKSCAAWGIRNDGLFVWRSQFPPQIIRHDAIPFGRRMPSPSHSEDKQPVSRNSSTAGLPSSALSDLASILRLGVSSWWSPQRENMDRFYSMCPEAVARFLGGRLLNFGYWSDATPDQQTAARALVDKVAQLAQLRESDHVLDVGCGFGTAALIFSETYRANRVVGVNVTRHHLEFARQQVRNAGMSDQVTFQYGDATDLPFDDHSFDKVIALESAFHFDPRSVFLREAARVLKPGGRLTLADVVPLHASQGRLTKYIAARLWLVPAANNYGPAEYHDKLRSAGFEEITIQSVGDHVYPGYTDWTLRPENRVRLLAELGHTKAILYRWQTQLLRRLHVRGHIDYSLISATKPQ